MDTNNTKQRRSSDAGFYISIEGIDGSGKTSIIRELADRSYPVPENKLHQGPKLTRMPGGSSFGEKLRDACRNEDISTPVQLFFYAALSTDCVEQDITPALNDGRMVLCDRGFGTLFAYQGLNIGYSKQVLNILQTLSHLPPVDLTIYLNVDMDRAIEREGGLHRSNDRYGRSPRISKETIKEAYELLYGANRITTHIDRTRELDEDIEKIRTHLTKKIVIIDSNGPLEKVVADCYGAIVQAIIERLTPKPLVP